MSKTNTALTRAGRKSYQSPAARFTWVRTPTEIIEAAARAVGIEPTRVLDRRRNPSIVRVRAAVVWLLRVRNGMSAKEIADAIGHLDHTTILRHLRSTCHSEDTQLIVAQIEAILGSKAA